MTAAGGLPAYVAVGSVDCLSDGVAKPVDAAGADSGRSAAAVVSGCRFHWRQRLLSACRHKKGRIDARDNYFDLDLIADLDGYFSGYYSVKLNLNSTDILTLNRNKFYKNMNIKNKCAIMHASLTAVMAFVSVVFIESDSIFLKNQNFNVMFKIIEQKSWASVFFSAAIFGICGLITRSIKVKIASVFALSTIHGVFALFIMLSTPMSFGAVACFVLACQAYHLVWRTSCDGVRRIASASARNACLHLPLP
jgi:hypothetical protein